MSYLHVRNWEKHQHRDFAGKKSQPWFRMATTLFDDAAVCELTADGFRAYVRALTLAGRTGNQIPAMPAYLRSHFGRSWRPLLTQLQTLNLVTGELPPAATRKRVGSESGAPTSAAPVTGTAKPRPNLPQEPLQNTETGRDASESDRSIRETRTNELRNGYVATDELPEDARARDNNAAHSGSSGNVMDGFMRIMEERAAREASSLARLADEDAMPP